ncbi:MAG: hypothetical protein LT070_13605 [Solirubrobacteraceae bacterium]|nr:hypothetical protein [Solirubrobacteraceae bacterium]
MSGRSCGISPRGVAAGAAAAALAAAALAGCGGGERQDANEPRGAFVAEIVASSFPRSQDLAQQAALKVTVRNAGERVIPNVALTVDGFARRATQPDLADPERPVWVVDQGPADGPTAYVNTWALGPLAPDEERTFAWSVTAVRPGTHTVRFRVGAGLDGRARAVTSDDRIPEGAITVHVTRRPRESSVDPKTGDVLHEAG